MWTTIRDVRSAVVDSLGGHAACSAMGIDANRLDQAAREAWRAEGVGRYDAADADVRSSVLEHAHRALAD